MQDKTAMQQMIDWIQVYCDHQPYLLPEEVKRKATELLEVEKNNIADAWEHGDNNNVVAFTGNDYYQNKYNKI